MAEFRTGIYILSLPIAVSIKDDGQIAALTGALINNIRSRNIPNNLAIGTPHIEFRWDDEQEEK